MYALNIKKGTTLQHPELGVLYAGEAVFIPDRLVPIAKSLRGVVVFDSIRGISEAKEKQAVKKIYDKEMEELKEEIQKAEEKLTYSDFVKKYKDVKLAAKKWEEYKKSKAV